MACSDRLSYSGVLQADVTVVIATQLGTSTSTTSNKVVSNTPSYAQVPFAFEGTTFNAQFTLAIRYADTALIGL